MKKTVSEISCFTNFFQPSRPVLCATKNADGSDHLAPFSWFNPVSYAPPIIMISISSQPNASHSLHNIHRTREFSINFLQNAYADRLLAAAFPAEGENKFDRSEFARETCSEINVCAVKESLAFLECRVREIHSFGETDTVIADVLAASYDEAVFTPPKMLVNLKNYDPIFHMDQYDHSDYQLHTLLSVGREYVADVPYPSFGEEGDPL